MKAHVSAASAASLTAFRRGLGSLHIALLTLTAFLFTLVPPWMLKRAEAQSAPGRSAAEVRSEIVQGGIAAEITSMGDGTGPAQSTGARFATPTGASTYTYEFDRPTARGEAQPRLAISYASSRGQGLAGLGFELGVTSITRLPPPGSDNTRPKAENGYDPAFFDQYTTSDGAELLYICQLNASATCAETLPGEVMPQWAAGWSYFRPRVEETYDRYFLSRDRRTFRVQSKNGVNVEIGAALDGTNDEAYQVTSTNEPFKWFASRAYDAIGDVNDATGRPKPVNAILFRYERGPNMSGPSGEIPSSGSLYLRDIYDTSPRATAATAQPSAYAHHSHFTYEKRPDPQTTFVWGGRYDIDRRLTLVDITSKTFASAESARELVRRYRLVYVPNDPRSILRSIELEGKCSPNLVEGSNELLPTMSACPTLPPTTFGYEEAKAPVFESVVELTKISQLGGAPSVPREVATTYLDVNGDGLPDVLSTDPALFGAGQHGVFLNGADGAIGKFTPQSMNLVLAGSDTAQELALSNPNLLVGDFDGNGRVELLHMPKGRTTTLYALEGAGNKWGWRGRVVNAESGLDLATDGANVRVADVNGDGAADVLRTTPAGVETYFSLTGFPGGYGRFGTGRWTSPIRAALSPLPATSCAPASPAGAVLLSDPDVRLADINGDRLVDLALVREGRVQVWLGRGDGSFGTDARRCAGGLSTGGDFLMPLGDAFAPSPEAALRFGDVTGDKLDDLVVVDEGVSQVWRNINGLAWSPPLTVRNALGKVDLAHDFTLADLSGRGVQSLVWTPRGTVHVSNVVTSEPLFLRRISNGYGATSDLVYAPSAKLMAEARAQGQTWKTTVPASLWVVTKVAQRDNLDLVGRPGGSYVTKFDYADPFFDPIRKQFRGFRVVTETALGDASGPTRIARTVYHLGECRDEAHTPWDDCDPTEAWRGNARDALAGKPRSIETLDAAGNYLESVFYSYRLRGLSGTPQGKRARTVFVSRTDTVRYDTGPFVRQDHELVLPAVELEPNPWPSAFDPGGVTSTENETVMVRSAKYAHLTSTVVADLFGNPLEATDQGCRAGCADADEAITRHYVWKRPAGDLSAWAWRVDDTSTTGARAPGELRHRTLVDFNALGRPTAIRAVLSGTLALDRFHEDPAKDTAPAPPGASSDGTITVATFGYDELGNATSSRMPNKRCASIDYDPVYGQLATTNTAHAGAAGEACGDVELKTFATFDRGLELVTQEVGYNGELSRVDYDGFGRVKQAFRPSPVAAGELSGAASVKHEYFVTPNQPFAVRHTSVQDAATHDGASYREHWYLTDGFGRTIVSFHEADPAAGDGGQWIASGLPERNAKGDVTKGYVPWFFDGDPSTLTPGQVTPTARATTATFDAFGRVTSTTGLDGAVASSRVYHALSIDGWDAEDLDPASKHAATPTTSRMDGHGRVVSQIQRMHVAGAIQEHETRAAYLPSGEVTKITRENLATRATVARWMRYDSLGRRVLNVDPDASAGFNAEGALTPTLKAWRYAFNDNGDLVGTSDARGCGVNIHYDAGGRIRARDVSPCLSTHDDYTGPDLASGEGTELFNEYDALRISDVPWSLLPVDKSFLRGRLTTSYDRGAVVVAQYDGRGNANGLARKIARPGPTAAHLDERYTIGWYAKTRDLDSADREVRQTTGARVSELLGAMGQSFVSKGYSKRGVLTSVAGSYGALLSKRTLSAEGNLLETVYADAAKTTTALTYDKRLRTKTVQTYRAKAPQWTASPPTISPAPNDAAGTTQLVLESLDYVYDKANNPLQIRDLRTASEWPAGAKPVSRTMQYDDLYRLTEITLTHAGGDDAWTSPYKAENAGAGTGARPSPHVSFTKRVKKQGFTYDWLGNTTATSDDANGFYDRSLGTITNGTPNAGPYQLKEAVIPTPPPRRDVPPNKQVPVRSGSLSTAYDAAGNMTSLQVNRDGPCLPTGAGCSQRFVYDWDEDGHLARARRWDTHTKPVPLSAHAPVPSDTPSVDLRYVYDAGGDRVLKSATDGRTQQALHSVYVFDSLELRHARFNGADFERTSRTETVRLAGLARVVHGEEDMPSLASGRQHVLLELEGHLGSTATIIDRDTGELVEKMSYQAYGATESDYRPERWKAFREDYRFTGKEEDIEVGLTYFGHRYLAPQLGRWLSADPLTIHGLGDDLNAYAYVRGQVMSAVDLDGLKITHDCRHSVNGCGGGSTGSGRGNAGDKGSSGGAVQPGGGTGGGGTGARGGGAGSGGAQTPGGDDPPTKEPPGGDSRTGPGGSATAGRGEATGGTKSGDGYDGRAGGNGRDGNSGKSNGRNRSPSSQTFDTPNPTPNVMGMPQVAASTAAGCFFGPGGCVGGLVVGIGLTILAGGFLLNHAITEARQDAATKETTKAAEIEAAEAADDEIEANPKPKSGETEHTKRGRKAHDDWDPGAGFKKKVKLPSGREIDALDAANRVIKEFKPNTARKIREGMRQLEEYAAELTEMYGGEWELIVETYDP